MKLRYSIFVTTYCRSRFLSKCLSSIQKALRGRGDAEVVVCDDGSTNWGEISEIIDSYNGHICNLRPICAEHLGIVGNWNRCIDEARGDYLIIIGDDDEICEDAFDVWDAWIVDEADVYLLAYKIIDLDGATLATRAVQEVETIFDLKRQLITEESFVFNGILDKLWHSFSMLAKRQVYDRFRYVEAVGTGADVLMQFRIFESNYRVSYVSRPTFLWRCYNDCHGGNISSSLANSLQARVMVYKFYDKTDYRTSILNRILISSVLRAAGGTGEISSVKCAESAECVQDVKSIMLGWKAFVLRIVVAWRMFGMLRSFRLYRNSRRKYG